MMTYNENKTTKIPATWYYLFFIEALPLFFYLGAISSINVVFGSEIHVKYNIMHILVTMFVVLCYAVVFMGSKKYPGENTFDAFTTKHGGYDNACTDYEAVSSLILLLVE